jgi:hypothetical protein
MRPKPGPCARESHHAPPINSIPEKNANYKLVTMPRSYAIRTTLLQRVNCLLPRLRGIVVQLPQLAIPHSLNAGGPVIRVAIQTC